MEGNENKLFLQPKTLKFMLFEGKFDHCYKKIAQNIWISESYMTIITGENYFFLKYKAVKIVVKVQ